jgi:hypothetical protein
MSSASIASPISVSTATPAKGLDHRMVWRWHFYAGLFCIPFVLWLSVTGTIFLFHPQIQRLLDRPYEHLTITQRATANAQVQAALAAVPGTTLDSYQLPSTPTSAAEILVDKGAQQFRVYVHPQTAAVLKIDDEDHRVDVFMSRLHGELLIGKYGSWIVELAASWAVIMILTGLFLWWPATPKAWPEFDLDVLAAGDDLAAILRLAMGRADLHYLRLGCNLLLNVRLQLRGMAGWIGTRICVPADICKKQLVLSCPLGAIDAASGGG